MKLHCVEHLLCAFATLLTLFSMQNELIDQTVVNEEQAKQVVNTMQLHHHHAIEKKAENVKRTGRDEALHRCGCDVLVGAVKFLKRPVAAFIRLDVARTLGEMTTEGHFPTKFIFLCLGPIGQDVDEFHEVWQELLLISVTLLLDHRPSFQSVKQSAN